MARATKRMIVDLDQATSAEITYRHCYITLGGRRYRTEKKYNDGTGSRGSRTTSGPRPISELSEAQKLIIVESFKRFAAVDVSPGAVPAHPKAADLRVKVSYTLPAGLIEDIRDEAIATGEPVSRVVERRLTK